MQQHNITDQNGRSVIVVRRTHSDSRRAPAGSPPRVEHVCQPAPLVGLADLDEIAGRVRRLTVIDEASADVKLDCLRMIGRLKKRFRT